METASLSVMTGFLHMPCSQSLEEMNPPLIGRPLKRENENSSKMQSLSSMICRATSIITVIWKMTLMMAGRPVTVPICTRTEKARISDIPSVLIRLGMGQGWKVGRAITFTALQQTCSLRLCITGSVLENRLS